MKKTIFLSLLFAAILTACGVGSYSISGGVSDEAYVCFVADKEFSVLATIDGKQYNTRTIKSKEFKKRRDIKNTSSEHISVGVGTHDVTVEVDGNVVLSKKIIVSSGETKIIKL